LRSEGLSLAAATLHGSAGIAVPTMVSTLAISCVFTSVVFLEGPAKFLFTPLGVAVVFAMLASYALSRTLTPLACCSRASTTARAPARAAGLNACIRHSSAALNGFAAAMSARS
jgi:multidrug efflux pump subunit AcrB